jgi:hypothetical protein
MEDIFFYVLLMMNSFVFVASRERELCVCNPPLGANWLWTSREKSLITVSKDLQLREREQCTHNFMGFMYSRRRSAAAVRTKGRSMHNGIDNSVKGFARGLLKMARAIRFLISIQSLFLLLMMKVLLIIIIIINCCCCCCCCYAMY